MIIHPITIVQDKIVPNLLDKVQKWGSQIHTVLRYTKVTDEVYELLIADGMAMAENLSYVINMVNGRFVSRKEKLALLSVLKRLLSL